MKKICCICGKSYKQKNPLIDVCNKCSKKGIKSLQDYHNEYGKYCSFKYSCPRSEFYGKYEPRSIFNDKINPNFNPFK